MPVTVLELISNTDGGAPALTYTTISVAPAAQRFLMLNVLTTHLTTTPPLPAITGLGLSWLAAFGTRLIPGSDGQYRWMSHHLALTDPIYNCPPTPGPCTLTYSALPAGVAWSLLQFYNVDLTPQTFDGAGNPTSSGAVVQHKEANGTGSVCTVTMSAFASSSNATLAFTASRSASIIGGIGPPGLITQFNPTGGGAGSTAFAAGHMAETEVSPVQSTLNGSNNWMMEGIELKFLVPPLMLPCPPVVPPAPPTPTGGLCPAGTSIYVMRGR